MEEITEELNKATEYLRAMKRTGAHKGNCDNVLMHLANIEDLVNKFFIPVVGVRSEQLFCKCGKPSKYTYIFKEINKKIHTCEEHKAK